MFYLVLALWTYTSVVLPEKYTYEQCEIIGKKAKAEGRANGGYACIPAPAKTICRVDNAMTGTGKIVCE